MSFIPIDYTLFFKFIETYAPQSFQGIDPDNPLVLELEQIMETKNQFFYIADLIQMKILHTSLRSKIMLGVEPAELTPYHFFLATHPDDLGRNSRGRAQLFKLAHELFDAEKGHVLLSTNLHLRNPSGTYSNILSQLYLFYSTIPYKSVYLLKIHTNIDGCKKMKHGFHYYLGTNLANLRFPDEELLTLGVPYSDRELEIIKLIESGLNSEQIAARIFLSIHTVNTHRKNILAKSGKETMADVIYDLITRGLI